MLPLRIKGERMLGMLFRRACSLPCSVIASSSADTGYSASKFSISLPDCTTHSSHCYVANSQSELARAPPLVHRTSRHASRNSVTAQRLACHRRLDRAAQQWNKIAWIGNEQSFECATSRYLNMHTAGMLPTNFHPANRAQRNSKGVSLLPTGAVAC